ncbi:hypothetical protein T484DRAFT_1775078 [Baffinella frigidus]|nr:hypothetical protein T484DRAFT_1775078 [Cryptophyta sp. CCMP2293]
MAELFDDEDNLGDMGAEMAQFRVPKGAPTAVQRSIVESFISRFGKRGIAEVILRNGVLVEAVAHAAMAVSTNCGPTLDHLVRQYGLDVNKPIRGPPDEDAWQCGSLLSFACQEGNTNAVRKLIALKADPNLHDAGLECPAIFAAGEQGHIGCLLALLEAGAEVDLQKPSSGNTALHISAQ